MVDQPESVLFSIIRRAWPQLIANSIIGVQPITGPAASIFNFRTRYSYKPGITNVRLRMIDPIYFKHFLRLNSRKKSFTPEHIKSVGYPVIELNISQYKLRGEIHNWCEATFPYGSWMTDGYDYIVFSRPEYEVQFKLTWAE